MALKAKTHALSGFMYMLLKQRQPITAVELDWCQPTFFGEDDYVAQSEA